MSEQPERDVEADVVTVEITPDISRSLAALNGVQRALAPLVIAELRERLAAAEAAIAQVHEIHKPEPLSGGYNPYKHTCTGCEPEEDRWHAGYPCPTVTAIHGALHPECDAAEHHFDRSGSCPEPCGKWHTRCDNCGRSFDECVLDGPETKDQT